MDTETHQRDWTPDASQQAVIDAHGGCHLVLAPPGCGKTQILTERIRKAHSRGIAYDQMVCLTFTNRAARSMKNRIAQYIDDPDVDKLYVGNVHRFCSKYLFDHNVVPAESSIIDEDDAVSILARYLDEDENRVNSNRTRKNDYQQVFFLSHFMYQIEHHHPKELRLHGDSLMADDVKALRYICKVEHSAFNQQKLIDVYNHTDYYRDATRMDGYDSFMRPAIDKMLRKMRFAHAYQAYKNQNKLLDFEDLLTLTYDELRHAEAPLYSWLQVDEVQDLNPLQMAIIDLLVGLNNKTSEGDGPEVMYLGDEQQAIFSFMGAKMDTLESLKVRCKGHIHYLGMNHRSPKYLLEVFNTYAQRELHISPELLPVACNEQKPEGNVLSMMSSQNIDSEYVDVARFVQNIYQTKLKETVAVIVNSNRDADQMDAQLRKLALPHFKVSGLDLFSTHDMKLLLAHFNVISNDTNFISWSHILQGMDVFQTHAAARDFVHKLFLRAATPSDFLFHDDGKTYVQDFAEAYEQQEMVIFDTETTGLDVFEDDILQIAAVKIRNGKVVEGSQFSVYIETDRPIPAMLGDVVNPIVEERKHQTLLSHREALRRFIDYVGDDMLLGHNADYDYNIMDFNLRRYLPEVNWRKEHPRYFDSLKLAHLLEPGMKAYKLKNLLEQLHLEGENSHLADADVDATRSLVVHCYAKAKEIIPSQQAFLSLKTTQGHAEMLRKNYKELYFHTLNMLYEHDFESKVPVLTSEMDMVYRQLRDSHRIEPIQQLKYVLTYISVDLIDKDAEPSLKEQLDKHIVEINTLKEADLCNSSTITDRVFVTTVHKAKGLEFDNVVVFDAVDGRYPNFYSKNDPQALNEDARKFYVAMSRAKKRLFIAYSEAFVDYRGGVHPRQLTPFMKSIKKFFKKD
jgi:DNA helicase-2/ATP-dependent DNA helicase PcrA